VLKWVIEIDATVAMVDLEIAVDTDDVLRCQVDSGVPETARSGNHFVCWLDCAASPVCFFQIQF
jgi:hypothetical protein